MIGLSNYTANQLSFQGHNHGENSGAQAVRIAVHQYRSARLRGQLARVWSRLIGKSNSLFDLVSLRAECSVRSSHYAGTRAVSIDRIRGSEGRSEDFDAGFRPIQSHNKDRWIGIAAARQRGMALPPVELVQVGDVYFVRDGHHRISVAREMGEEAVDAEVTVLDVAGPLPWERRAVAGQLAGQPA